MYIKTVCQTHLTKSGLNLHNAGRNSVLGCVFHHINGIKRRVDETADMEVDKGLFCSANDSVIRRGWLTQAKNDGLCRDETAFLP